jgi:hypothetical protein
MGQTTAFGSQTVGAFSNQEYVRNGTFDAGLAAWFSNSTWGYVAGTAGQDGGQALATLTPPPGSTATPTPAAQIYLPAVQR